MKNDIHGSYCSIYECSVSASAEKAGEPTQN